MADTLQSFQPGDERWHAYRKRALSDLFWFNHTVLGYSDIFPLLPETHLLFHRFMERKTGHALIDTAPLQLVMMPRGAGKTTCGTRGHAIQLACANPNIAILIANERQENANAFLSEIKAQFQNNELLCALFPEVIPDFRTTTWAAEAATLKRPRSRPEPTFQTIGVGGTVTGMHFDVIFCDDLISREAMENARAGAWGIMDKTNRWVNQLKPLLNPQHDPFPWIRFIGCIAEGTPILMASGAWKPIEKVGMGDVVVSWDEEKRQFCSQRVNATVPQGTQPVVRVRTRRHEIHTTSNHPFLSKTSRGTSRWRTAARLKRFHAFLGPQVEGTEQSPYDPWLLGFLWGDGWVTKYVGKTKRRGTSYSVCVALGVDETLNKRVEAALRKDFGGTCYRPLNNPTTCRLDNNTAGRALERIGLTPGKRAPYKRLPEWLFNCSVDDKRAFLRGLCDADGHDTATSESTLSSASKNLIEDVYWLAQTCGVRVSKPWSRTRNNRILPEGRTLAVSHEHQLHLAFDATPVSEKVLSVESMPLHVPVYDLVVANTKNFVAAGFVVHNTNWWQGDTYGYIEKAFTYEEAPQRVRLTARLPTGGSVSHEAWRAGDLAVFKMRAEENGRAVFPAIYDLDELARLRQVDPELYACNYLNEPVNASIRTFQDEWLRYYDWLDRNVAHYRMDDGSTRNVAVDALSKVLVCDPAFTASGGGARSAIVVVGTDTETGKHLVLDAIAERVDPKDLVNDILNTAQSRGVRRIFIEAVAQQLGFIQFVQAEAQRRSLPLAIETVKPGGRNKDVRIEGLAAHFKSRTILVHPTMLDLLREYSSFRPGARLKDLLDALAYSSEVWTNISRPMGGYENTTARQQKQNELNSYYARRGVSAAARVVPRTIDTDW